MQELAAYWIGVCIRALKTYPSFIGSNWTGVFLSVAYLLYRARKPLRAYLANRPLRLGWRIHAAQLWNLMKTDWKAIIAIPVCFWLGHVLQIAFQDQQGLAKKNGDLRIRVDRDKQGFREELQRQSGAFLTKISSLKETNAGDKSRIDELDKQVQSQRNTIDNFGSQLIKAVAKPLIVTPLVFDKNGDNAVHKRLRWIVLTNQAAGAQKVRIVCSAPIKVESITVLGGGGLGYLPQKVTANMWDQNLGSPWTPTTPLLVEMSYGAGVTDDFACSFTPR